MYSAKRDGAEKWYCLWGQMYSVKGVQEHGRMLSPATSLIIVDSLDPYNALYILETVNITLKTGRYVTARRKPQIYAMRNYVWNVCEGYNNFRTVGAGATKPQCDHRRMHRRPSGRLNVTARMVTPEQRTIVSSPLLVANISRWDLRQRRMRQIVDDSVVTWIKAAVAEASYRHRGQTGLLAALESGSVEGSQDCVNVF